MGEEHPQVPEEELAPVDDAVIGRALRGSAVVVLVLAAVVASVLWGLSGEEGQEAVKPKDLTRIENLEPATGEVPVVAFRDVTAAAGIRFVHASGARGEKLLPETMGAGAAFFDADGDGDQDLLLTNGNPWPHDKAAAPVSGLCLYLNDGKGSFTDVTQKAGLAVPCYAMGPAVGDIDNDGDQDLFVATLGRNLLFRNDGGVFAEIGAAAGVAGAADGWSSSAGFFDYDDDGDLDLFVCNYVKWSREIDGKLAFTLNGRDRAYGPPTNYEGTFPCLYRNDGAGRFTDVSEEAGLHVVNRATGAPVGKALAVAFFDFDADGDQDVIVANDTVRNFLFRNEGDGTFVEVGMMSGVGFDSEGKATGAMGIDVARYRDMESVGVAIGNFANEMSSLFVAAGKGLQFNDEANAEGIGSPSRLRLTFGLFFFDYDLDGRLDFLQANGHIEDAIQQVQPSQQYAQPAQLFWNRGPAAPACFVPVPDATLGDLPRPMVGRAACYADIDGDLDLDVLLTEVGGAPRLLRNDQQLGHHALRLVLRGTTSNRDAIGARVVVEVAGATLERHVAPTRSYLSQVELPVTVGLGRRTLGDVRRVTVHWPRGGSQEVPRADLRLDGTTLVTEAR